MFGYTSTEYKDPRTETFMDMLRLNVCPQLTFYSFSVIFAIVLIACFGVQLGVDRIDTSPPRIASEFLPINTYGKFTGELKNDVAKVRENYQLYRAATSLFVHRNFQHLFSNALMLIIWTSMFETFLTTFKVPIIFMLSGIIGNFASMAIDGGSSLGASTGLFGIVGAGLGYVIFNWQNMAYANSPRNFLLCQIAFMVIITFLLSGPQQRTSAHIFGLISGVFLGFCMTERFSGPNSLSVGLSTHERTVKRIGMALTISLAALFIALTMLTK